jgi:hypothetical protein
MTQSLETVLPMFKERQKAEIKSKEIKRLIREANQEAEGIERHQADYFMQALYGDGEDSEGGAA